MRKECKHDFKIAKIDTEPEHREGFVWVYEICKVCNGQALSKKVIPIQEVK
jgi:hypothetical protein